MSDDRRAPVELCFEARNPNCCLTFVLEKLYFTTMTAFGWLCSRFFRAERHRFCKIYLKSFADRHGPAGQSHSLTRIPQSGRSLSTTTDAMSNIIKDGEITKEFSVYRIGEGVDYLPAGRGATVPCPDAEGSEGAWRSAAVIPVSAAA